MPKSSFSTKQVMNADGVRCLFVDDCPIGFATWRDGIASATVTYDGEIKYFNSDDFYDIMVEISAYVRSVDQHYEDMAAQTEADDEAVTPMGHTERKPKDGRVFGGWALR